MDDSRATILIVDDMPDNIDILNGILKEQYRIKAARSGEKALEISDSDNPPDLILLDVVMPGLNGFEVCLKLKERISTRNIPVIFVTAKNDDFDEARGFEVGAVDYITKPVSPPIVKARVKTQLALYDQNRALDQLVRERTEQLHETRLEIIRRLGVAAEYKDNETGLHVVRMSHVCRKIGEGAGICCEEADLLMHASPMHDVGKIGIPDAVLLKPGKLDEQEWSIMKTHTTIGAKIIGNHSSEILRTARTLALTHHEKWDGTGYPAGLKAENIPVMARIVAISDVFDALTSVRPYKKAWKVDDAIAEMERGAGAHFDPSLVRVFIRHLPEINSIRAQYSDNATPAEGENQFFKTSDLQSKSAHFSSG